MKTLTVLASLLLSSTALASPENFSSCQASLVLEKFTECPDSTEPCQIFREELGDLVTDLTVTSRDQASGKVVFKAKNGTEISSELDCALTDENGDVNDMQCVMRKSVDDRLGRLNLSFNSAEAPYYVAVFHEFGNAPIGSFITEDDCQQ